MFLRVIRSLIHYSSVSPKLHPLPDLDGNDDDDSGSDSKPLPRPPDTPR